MNADVANIYPGFHEEADTRKILHVADAALEGCKKVYIRTEVVVLAISAFNQMALDELWIGFGTGGNFRYTCQPMKWQEAWISRNVLLCHSVMPLLGVIQFLLLVDGGRRLPGRRGKYSRK